MSSARWSYLLFGAIAVEAVVVAVVRFLGLPKTEVPWAVWAVRAVGILIVLFFLGYISAHLNETERP